MDILVRRNTHRSILCDGDRSKIFLVKNDVRVDLYLERESIWSGRRQICNVFMIVHNFYIKEEGCKEALI